jgi:hypothetical protein
MNKFQQLFTTALLVIILVSCHRQHGEYKIYPLSPFTDAVIIKNRPAAGQEFIPQIKTYFYIVEESTDLTDKTRVRLENFIITHMQKEIHSNRAIYFTFYKGGLTFGRNSTQTKTQLNIDHANDKLAEFEYKDGKLYNFDFYKNGTYYTHAAEAERGRPDGGYRNDLNLQKGEQ